MRCPKCGSLEDKVIDSRLSKDGSTIRRRRECLDCATRYTTYEQIERIELRAIKRDGRHEPFDRQKLLGSIAKACEKRPIGIDEMERAVEEIIHDLESGAEREIPTRLIGAKVMERLHALDPVAYVRYASVYRQFQEIGDFIEEIQSFEKRTSRSSAQPELFRT
ncbi:MAG: transcriptional regulator NrdR [Terrimicrobiaceae bacterium]|nr:transcriptional regulator NrdR [Terrimicrobiaceae bacterium]